MKNIGRISYLSSRIIGWLFFLAAFLYAILVGAGVIFRMRADVSAFRGPGELAGTAIDLTTYILTGILFLQLATFFKEGDGPGVFVPLPMLITS